MQKFDFQVGQFYKTRSGKVVVIDRVYPIQSASYPILTRLVSTGEAYETYTLNGAFRINYSGPRDIVERCNENGTPFVETESAVSMDWSGLLLGPARDKYTAEQGCRTADTPPPEPGSTVMRSVDVQPDLVNRPAHYPRGQIEVISAIEDWQLGYHRGQVIKYVARAGHKDATKEVEDLQKAKWYLEREILRLTTQVTIPAGVDIDISKEPGIAIHSQDSISAKKLRIESEQTK